MIHEVSRRLVKEGFDIGVICKKEKDTKRYETIDGVRVYRTFGFKPFTLKYDLGRVIPRMLFSVVKNDADIVHAHNYGHFPLWASIFSNKPTIITTHSDPTTKIYPLWDLLRAIPIRLCDHVVALTEMEKRNLIKRGVSPRNISVIPNGATLPPMKVPDIKLSNVIICIGRLDISTKGQDILIQAMPKVLSKVPDAKLWIVGKGNDLDMLRKMARRLSVAKNVKFKGSIDEFTKALYLKNCNLFCLPSRIESFGIVFLEAMAYGLPIIATKVGGVPEVVEDAGFLVPPNDPSSLADALIQVLTDRFLSDNLRKRSLERVKQFDWNVIAKKYKELYLSY